MESLLPADQLVSTRLRLSRNEEALDWSCQPDGFPVAREGGWHWPTPYAAFPGQSLLKKSLGEFPLYDESPPQSGRLHASGYSKCERETSLQTSLGRYRPIAVLALDLGLPRR
jgi:hypothetical protein